MNVTLNLHERIDYLLDGQLSIIQSKAFFSFSTDAILVAHFATVPQRQEARIIDFCSGTGVIPLLLSQKTRANIVGVEIQDALIDMANRSTQLNDLTDRIQFIHADLNTLSRPKQLYDVVTCNPPYFSVENKMKQHHLTSHAIARHEVCLTLAQWIKKAQIFLKDKGKLVIVYRPDRLDDLMETLLAHNFSVQKLQFAHSYWQQAAKIVLVEAIYRGGRQGVKVLPPIVIYDDEGNYTPQMQAIYRGEL